MSTADKFDLPQESRAIEVKPGDTRYSSHSVPRLPRHLGTTAFSARTEFSVTRYRRPAIRSGSAIPFQERSTTIFPSQLSISSLPHSHLAHLTCLHTRLPNPIQNT